MYDEVGGKVRAGWRPEGWGGAGEAAGAVRRRSQDTVGNEPQRWAWGRREGGRRAVGVAKAAEWPAASPVASSRGRRAGSGRAGGLGGAFGLGLPGPPGAGAVLVASCSSHSRAVIPSVSPQPSSMQSFRRSSLLACSSPPPFTRMCRSLSASSTRRQSSTPPAPVILPKDRAHEPSAALAYSLTPAAPLPRTLSLQPFPLPHVLPSILSLVPRFLQPPPCLTLASVYFSCFLQPPASPSNSLIPSRSHPAAPLTLSRFPPAAHHSLSLASSSRSPPSSPRTPSHSHHTSLSYSL